MAQVGFLLTDEGRTLTVVNASSGSTIYAGDVVYAVTNDDRFGTAASSVLANYSADDVKVKAAHWSATAYKTIIGVAITDIAPGEKGTIAMEGLFLHPVSGDTEAGDPVQFYAGTAQKLTKVTEATATVTSDAVNSIRAKIGRALTGGSADGQYILWKLTL